MPTTKRTGRPVIVVFVGLGGGLVSGLCWLFLFGVFCCVGAIVWTAGWMGRLGSLPLGAGPVVLAVVFAAGPFWWLDGQSGPIAVLLSAL